MRSILVVAVSACLAVTAANAQDLQSANVIAPGCETFVRGTTTQTNELWREGHCVGVVMTLFAVGRILPPKDRFCPPPKGTLGKSVPVVVSYINSIPHRRNEPFVDLAIEAFRKAWPCPLPRAKQGDQRT